MLMDDCKPNRHFFADRCCHWTNSKLIRIPNCSSKSLRIPIRVTDDIPTWTEFLRMVSNRSSQTHSPALAPQSKCSLALCLFDTLVAHTGELNNAGWTPGSGRPTLPGDMYFAASVGLTGESYPDKLPDESLFISQCSNDWNCRRMDGWGQPGNDSDEARNYRPHQNQVDRRAKRDRGSFGTDGKAAHPKGC